MSGRYLDSPSGRCVIRVGSKAVAVACRVGRHGCGLSVGGPVWWAPRAERSKGWTAGRLLVSVHSTRGRFDPR